MNKLFIYFLLISISGCSTNIVEESQEVSKIGKDYSDSVNTLIESTSNKIIDYDNNFIRRIRPSLDGMSDAEIKKDFDTKNKAISKTVKKLNELREASDLLKEYFILLGDAAEGNSGYGSKASENASIIIDDINNIYEVKDIENKITEKEKGYISNIFNIAGKALHARKIKSFIKKTATPVSKLLVYNRYLINSMKVSLETREKVRLVRIKKDLYKSFNSGNLDDSWASKRKDWLKSELKFPDLENAVKKSDELKESWLKVVSGNHDLKSFSNNLKDLSDTLKVIADYQKETKAKEQ